MRRSPHSQLLQSLRRSSLISISCLTLFWVGAGSTYAQTTTEEASSSAASVSPATTTPTPATPVQSAPVNSTFSKNLSWDQLTGNEQKILSPLENDWDLLSQDRKQKWRQVATRYEKMSATDQERLQSRMREWAKLSPTERRIARDNYLNSLNIPAEKKAEAWQAYQQLSAEERKKLAQEATQKKPSLVNSPSLKSK